jgi:hypothetical protein
MAAHEHLNGWPDLPRDGVELPELPPRPTPTDHARAYGTTVVLWSRLWPRVVDALEWLRGVWLGARGEVAALRDEIGALRDELRVGFDELRKRPSGRPRAQLPSIAAEQTIGGGIRLEGQAWEAVQRRLGELEEEVEEQQRARELAEAEARGATKAVETIEKARESRQKRITFGLAVAGAGGALLSWIATHFLHL